MNVVIYARYSSYKQTEQSIEGQLKECYSYAKRNNYTIIGKYIDEALTGTTDNRPQFLQMIEDSNKKTFNGILVYQLDRFARNRYDSAIYKNKLKKNSVRVFSARENISDDASGVLMESILEGMAEYYSVELAQKVQRGMNINASKFLYNGGYIPLGLKIDSNKHYIIDENSASIVQTSFNMYANNHTVLEIQNYINNNTCINKIFSKGSVRNLLSNKKYIGTYTYKGKETLNIIPPIIDVNLFNLVQDRLNKNKKAPSGLKTTNDYILTTKLFCGHCKEMMVGVSGTSHTEKRYEYYSCNKARKKLCNKKNVQKKYIENLVIEETRKILTDKNIATIASNVVAIANKEKNNSILKKLNTLLKENEKQKLNLLNSLKICDIDSVRKSIFEEIVKIEEKHKNIENQIKIENSQKLNLDIMQVKYFLEQMRSGNINDIKYRKMLVNVFINKIYLYDDNIGIFFNTQSQEFKSKIPTIEEIEVRIKNTSAHQN